MATSARIAHRISERSGRPGKPPPPPPPKRMRPRRRKSSSGVTASVRWAIRRPPRGLAPRAAPWPSSPTAARRRSPLGPQGPFVSAKRPRTRPPHPGNVLIGAEYRGGRRKTVASARRASYVPLMADARRSAERPSARRANSLAQASRGRRDADRRSDRPLRQPSATASSRSCGRRCSRSRCRRSADRDDGGASLRGP